MKEKKYENAKKQVKEGTLISENIQRQKTFSEEWNLYIFWKSLRTVTYESSVGIWKSDGKNNKISELTVICIHIKQKKSKKATDMVKNKNYMKCDDETSTHLLNLQRIFRRLALRAFA